MKKVMINLSKYDDLHSLDDDLLGENARLDIMLDKATGELWSDYCIGNSWKEYDDEDIIKIGFAENWCDEEALREFNEEDEDEEEEIDERVTHWECRIYDEIISGNIWDDYYNVENIVEVAQEVLDEERKKD